MKQNFNLLSGIIFGGFAVPLMLQNVVLSQVTQIPLVLILKPEETYSQLVFRAEDLATQVIEDIFRTETSLPEIRVVVLGKNNRAIAPILSLTVSRPKWEFMPSIKRWATYSPNSSLLLGLEEGK